MFFVEGTPVNGAAKATESASGFKTVGTVVVGVLGVLLV